MIPLISGLSPQGQGQAGALEQSGRISEKASGGRGHLVRSGSGQGEESLVAGGDGMGVWLSPPG